MVLGFQKFISEVFVNGKFPKIYLPKISCYMVKANIEHLEDYVYT